MSQTPTPSLAVHVAMETHIGRQRQQNQDAIGHLVPADPAVLDELGQIFVLADGVGGLKGGDLASQYALSTIISSYYDQPEGTPSDRLARAVAEANNIIYDEGQAQSATMATTVVAAVVRGRDLVIGSVGDSPAYLIREGRPRKLTLDHTVTAALPENGDEGSAGDTHKLVRALGVAASVKVDIITGRVRDGDGVVLCSDGLTRYVTPEEIERITTENPIEDAAKALIEMANERGGADNISVIVLQLADDEIAQLPPLDDPMLGWGRPRHSERTRPPAPTVRLGSRVKPPDDTAEPVDNPLRDLWLFLRGNTMLTAVGMSVLLVIFVVIMFVIASTGGGDDKESRHAAATQSAQRTATAVLVAEITEAAAAAQTADAIQAATAAEVVRLTLTPPTAIPTSGPQMSEGIWFRVLDGDPIPTSSAINGSAATPLEAGATYRVMGVEQAAPNGPWYQVVDNLGQETRWVNGPSLHERIVAIDAAGNPLPPDQQPLDVPPPDGLPPAARVTPVPFTGTPGEPGTPPPNLLTLSPTSRPAIPYGEESWGAGKSVTTKAALDLCRVPDVTACDVGAVAAGEIGTVVEGPVPAGDHWWWKVEFEDGRTGWIAQVLLGSSTP